MKQNLEQNRIVETAARLFLEKGFENVSLAEIAAAAAVRDADLYKYFGTKFDVILFIYQRINADWEVFAGELKTAELPARFAAAMLKKIELMEPYEALLGDLVGLLVKNSQLGVTSARTRHIRMRGLRIMRKLVDGARRRALVRGVNDLPALLYVVHWAILFLYVQTGDAAKTREIVGIVCKMLKRGDSFLTLLPLLPVVKDLTRLSDLVLEEKADEPQAASRQILKIVFNHRKLGGLDENCRGAGCELCVEKQLAVVDYFVSAGRPVHFILPAFPAKSPNRAKVLGALPDLGEETALVTLENLCAEIADAYPPGARVTICSDGRIFADLVGVGDSEVTAYGRELQKMIDRLELKNVDVVNLEDLLPAESFAGGRRFVIEKYAESLEDLRSKLKTDAEFKRLFNGIHRFISEDRAAAEPEKSKSKVKEESKPVALEVIRHSNAWTRFLAVYFPEAVRLSIHPYGSHAEKIGIRLTKAADDWLTPWHGVMVLTPDGYRLMKRREAEEAGARLVTKDSRGYYYALVENDD